MGLRLGLSPNSMETKAEKAEVAIIGGGPGGLMAAYRLEKRASFPCKITLYERCGRLGGKILTCQFAAAPGAYYEAGAAEFYDYSQLGSDPLRELIAELCLATSPMQSGGAIIRNRVIRGLGDNLREMSEATWKALIQFEQQARSLISRSDYYESGWRQGDQDALSQQSFYEMIRNVPDQAARDYIRIMAHSDLACEPHQTNAGYGLQNYLMDQPDYVRLYSIDGGNERLVQELARRISAQVRLEQPVVRVERTPNATYRVTSCHRGQMETADFDFVIAALPNDCIPTITWAGETLADAMDKHHQFYDHPAHYLRVTALFDRPFWRDQIAGSYFMSEAFGGCCLYDESSHFPGDGKGILAWLLAGEAALSMSNLDDASLIRHVIHSLPPILQPGRAHLLEASVHRWVGSVNALPTGFIARDPESRHQPEPAQHPRLFIVGDYLFDSTINGVLDSADMVVEWITGEPEPDRPRLPLDAARVANPGPALSSGPQTTAASSANAAPDNYDRNSATRRTP
jgi:monoamine oxidase